MRNSTYDETLTIARSLEQITGLLPHNWKFEQRSTPPTVSYSTASAALDFPPEPHRLYSLSGPQGNEVTFAVAVRSPGLTSTASITQSVSEIQKRCQLPILYISDYIGSSLRESLSDRGFNFADSTGWVRIVHDNPLVLLTGEGARQAPKDRESSSIIRLNGIASGRIIRSLIEAELPISVRALAKAAGVSPGSASKLLATLTAEGIVDRSESAGVATVNSRELLERWIQDYSFEKSNGPVSFFIAPRGLERTVEALASLTAGVTITGSAAARVLIHPEKVSVVPLRLLALYSRDPIDTGRSLGLIHADPVSANVFITVPQDREILPPSGRAVAPAPLVLADLMTLPGRSDAEAEQLMNDTPGF